MKKVLIVICVLIVLAGLLTVGGNVFEKTNGTLKTAEERITKILNKEYPDYEIKSIVLEYVDWSSTIREADKDHRQILIFN